MAPEEEEPAPCPAPYKSQRSLPLRVPPVFEPLPCVPAFEPPVYCDKSNGLFGSGLLPVVEVDKPVPEPVPPKSTGPYGAELPLPLVDEPVPDRSSPSPAAPSRGSNDGEDPRSDGGWQPPPRSDDLGQVRGNSVGFRVGAWLDPRSSPSETRLLRILSLLHKEDLHLRLTSQV